MPEKFCGWFDSTLEGCEFNMNVLITGGAGFIGSHLAEHLLASGYSVRVLDNLSTGKRENLPVHANIEFVLGDIRDKVLVSDSARGMDAIVHLAAVASVQASVDDPTGTHETNFDGTLHLLEAARNENIRRFLYASSAAVYGDNTRLPLVEDEILNPLSPYAADKLAGEYYLRFYHAKYGIETTAFRFFNIFGPRQDPSSPYSGVISIFIERVTHGKPVTIFGDGQQTRDFVYVGDLVKLLAQSLSNSQTAGQVINIGRGKQCSLNELLDALEKLTGKPVERNHAAARLGDIVHSRADTSRLVRLLGKIPQTDIITGLGEILRHQKI
jgi:UDP-glucose 4-epimerase